MAVDLKHFVKPKKHLGQHFLNDVSIAEKVASMFKGDGIDLPVLEIGPGTGVLTQYLLENFKEVRAIELDRESVAFLKENFVPKGLKLMEGDFLDSRNDEMFFPDDVLILGNFPYNISSQIVFKVLDNISKVKGFGGTNASNVSS